jgi:hypothetical protein
VIPSKFLAFQSFDALCLGFFYSWHVQSPYVAKHLAKTKSPRDQYFWHVGFVISLLAAVLGPRQPQARNVDLPTATAAAATTHGLARHFHYQERVPLRNNTVNLTINAKTKSMTLEI